MLSRSITVPAPAKLNLFLHITGQRADGYHTLQTVFQLIDFCDQLTITPLQSGELRLTTKNMPEPLDYTNNLVWRAAQLLKQASACPYGADLLLEKRIPAGGGLGGGSSDAASTLVTLNTLWETGLTIQELAALGLKLGADVPVFIYGKNAWAEGIGECLQPVSLPKHWFLVIVPPCHVETAKIFRHKDLTRNAKDITMAAFLTEGGKNDCEDVVRRLYPAVNETMELLEHLAYKPKMTGTGACVFSTFTDQFHASEALNALKTINPAINGFIAQGTNISLLHEKLNLES